MSLIPLRHALCNTSLYDIFFSLVRTTAGSEDSAVAKLARMVEEAANQRSKTEQIVENIAKIYTPVVVLLAVLLASVFFFFNQLSTINFFCSVPTHTFVSFHPTFL